MNNTVMNPGTERLFVWSGLALMVLMGVGLLIFAFFRQDTTSIRIGLMVAMFGSGLFVPFTIALFTQMKRIEAGSSPWSYLQLGTGIADMFLFILPLMILQAAIFRIDEISPEDLRSLNDLAWFLWIGTPPMVVWQMIAVGVVILKDHRPHPTFPRWGGYYNLWAALVSAAGATVPFFKTGPLAWDGAFAYWIPMVAFAGFILVNGSMMLAALNREVTARSEAVPA